MATYQKRGDRWRAIIRKRGHPSTSKSFRNKAQAKRWATDTEARMERMEWSDPSLLRELTLADMIDRYIEEVTVTGAMNPGKQRALDNFNKSLGTTPIAQLASRDLIQYATRRLEKVAPPTIGVELGYLHLVIKTATVSWGLPVSDGPLLQARAHLKAHGMTSAAAHRDRRPTGVELDMLRAYWEANPDQPDEMPMIDLMDFAIASAMRRGEIVRLAWSDINERDRTIIIHDRKDPRKKRGNDQVVPLLGDAWVIVQRQDRSGARIFPYRGESISIRWGRACKALGIADLRWHDLRHEGVSRLFEAGYSVPEVALVSGHKDWRHLTRYTQLKAADLHRVTGDEKGHPL